MIRQVSLLLLRRCIRLGAAGTGPPFSCALTLEYAAQFCDPGIRCLPPTTCPTCQIFRLRHWRARFRVVSVSGQSESEMAKSEAEYESLSCLSTIYS